MAPSQSLEAVTQFFQHQGLDIRQAPLKDFVSCLLGFYERVEFSNLAPDGGDMLLLQFGTYDWGAGTHFEFDITRQFITADEQDDDAISQLNCSLLYRPTPALMAVGEGDKWCSTRAELGTFQAFIEASSAYAAIIGEPVFDRRLAWSLV
ncbi:hypothetical protein [Oleomonas cavernae]|nr:hypothetical protein [Oleomonas cavernae]